MENRHVYRTAVRWESERKAALTSEGLPDLQVATPPEFPGGHPGIWSPEHLYVAAAEACLMTTFLAIAANSKLEFNSYESSAEGILEKTESGFQITEITMRPKIRVSSADSIDRARRIIEKAEQHCLIANSMKTTTHLEPDISVG